LLKTIDLIRKELVDLECWYDYLEEYLHERRFITAFKRYLNCIRENVLFIYPSDLNPDFFPPIIIQYAADEKLNDIFEKYCSTYFSYQLMSAYKQLFFIPEIRSEINA